ncbi:MAG: flagellin lysine-N-methylase [Lachnospiraceae bacterium]|nr:flagellin lysine-N-methylase [Lachnospiraceae bacterium]
MKKALVFKPEYYDNFSCKSSSCRQTCCAGWAITLSKEEYRKIQNSIRDEEMFDTRTYFEKMPPSQRNSNSYMKIILDQDKNCLFLNQQKLCSLQCHFGEGILPNTCSWFPRKLFENYGLICATISPACEKVLEMLPTDRSLTFSVREDYIGNTFPKSIPIQQAYPKDIYPYATYFQDIYSMCILTLQAQETSLEDRMILLGIGLEKIIQVGVSGQWDAIPVCVENYLSCLSELEDISTLLPSFSPNLSAVFNNFLMADNEPEGITSSYQKVMEHVKNVLHISYETDNTTLKVSAASFADYEKRKENFVRVMADRPYFMENLLLSIFTYRNLPFSEDLMGGIWENYIYLCWIYSSLKFVLTVCSKDISSHDELIALCTPLLRRWAHSSELTKNLIKEFKKNSSNTLAHMAVLLKSC